MLAAGGRVLYSTCWIRRAENEEVVTRLLAEQAQMRRAAMPEGPALAPGALDCTVGVQLLPGAEAGRDGFYFAFLQKTTGRTPGRAPRPHSKAGGASPPHRGATRGGVTPGGVGPAEGGAGPSR